LAVGSVFAVLFMGGMTLAVWLTSHSAKETKDKAPALAATASQAKLPSTPARQVRKAALPIAKKPAPAKPVRPPKKAAVRIVKNQPKGRKPGEKPPAGPGRMKAPPPEHRTEKPLPPEQAVAKYGTSVEFWKNPSDADLVAKKKDRLRFILHVSGNFEDPGCT
jgi:hypothetical protein